MTVRHPPVRWPAHSVLHHPRLGEEPPGPVSDGAAGLLGLVEHGSLARELASTCGELTFRSQQVLYFLIYFVMSHRPPYSVL